MSWQVAEHMEDIVRARELKGELQRMSGQVEGQVAETTGAISRPKREIKKPVRYKDSTDKG